MFALKSTLLFEAFDARAIVVIGWLDSLEVILYHFAGFHDLSLSLSLSLCEPVTITPVVMQLGLVL